MFGISLIQFGLTGKWINAVGAKGSGVPESSSAPKFDYWAKSDNFRYPQIQISPELIFGNEVQLLDPNFVSEPKDASEYEVPLKNDNILKTLRELISSWYVTLRTIAIIGLLSVLIYIGIKIIISSTGEKARYKEKLMDWIIAFCLLFFMHYIMAGLTAVVEKVDNTLGGAVNLTSGIPIDSDFGTVRHTTAESEEEEEGGADISEEDNLKISDDPGTVKYFINYARLFLNEKKQDDYTGMATAYLIIYIALVAFTAVFAIRYIKRVIYIALLTLFAPMVALTYPVDKMRDGRAQAWNMWFKEYIFNLIIQPFHLLIYSVLIGSAVELATSSLIYSVVALYMLIPAEKLLRKFFGFDNAGTLSAAGSFAGGALFSAMISKINKPKPQEPRDTDQGLGTRKPTMRSGSDYLVNPQDVILGGPSGGSNRGAQGTHGVQGAQGTPGSQGTGNTRIIRQTDGSTSSSSVNSQTMGNTNVNFAVDGQNGGTPTSADAGNSRDQQNAGDANSARRDVDPTIIYDDIPIPANLKDSVLPNGRRGLLEKEGLWERTKSAAGMVSANAKASLYNKARTFPVNAGRKLRRTVVGAAGAVPLAMLATGVAATTGDPVKAASMVAAGGAAGYNISNYYGDRVSNHVVSQAQAARTGFWGTDLKQIEQYKYDQRYMNDPTVLNTLVKGVGSQKALKHELDSGHVQAMLNNNITNPGKAAKTLALKNRYLKQNPNMSEDQAMVKAIAMAKWNRDINPGIFAPNSREQTIFKDTLRRQLEDNNYSGDIDKKIQDIMDDLEYFEV